MANAERLLEIARVFTPTSPVDEESLFAGRRDQLGMLIDAILQKGQHAILFGERGAGKTSLTNVLHAFLAMPRVITPRVNCDASDTLVSLFRKALSEVKVTAERPAVGFVGGTMTETYSIEELLSEDFGPDSIRRALSQLPSNLIAVFIFDEFDRLPQATKHSVADTIKSLSDHAVEATLVLVGVADSITELIEEHASVERALCQIRMPRMSGEEIGEIIGKGMVRLRMTIEPVAKSRIVQLSRGLPHFTHLLCLYACKRALEHEREIVELEDVEAAIESSLKNAQHSIQSAYHLATMSPRKETLFADVLLACALAGTDEMGYFAAQDVRNPMRWITGKDYEIPSFSQHLKEFTEPKRGSILQKIGSPRSFRFRFTNPMLQPFVIMKGYQDKKLN